MSTQLTPANGSENITSPVHFSWTSTGATTLYIDGVDVGIWDTSEETDWPMSYDDSTHSWYLVDEDHAQQSPTWTFTLLQPPYLDTFPSDQYIADGGSATFSCVVWNPATFQWYVDGSPVSDNSYISGATTDTLTIDPVSMEMNGFVIQCYISNDAGYVWSPEAVLYIVSPPVLNSPTANQTGVTNPVSFSWYNAGKACKLWIDSNLVLSNTTSTTYQTTLQGGSHTWFVEDADTGVRSETRTFTVSTPPPSLQSPANNQTEVDNDVTLTWTGTGDTYNYEVAYDSAFTQVVRSGSTASTSVALDLSGSFYWHVRAYGAGGWSGWSSSAHFTTTQEVPVRQNFVLGRLGYARDGHPNVTTATTLGSHKMSDYAVDSILATGPSSPALGTTYTINVSFTGATNASAVYNNPYRSHLSVTVTGGAYTIPSLGKTSFTIIFQSTAVYTVTVKYNDLYSPERVSVITLEVI